MKATFNLVSQPWILCTRKDGVTVELSLFNALTQAHELRSLEGDSPPETAAMIRLLLAVLHRVVDTHSPDAWMHVWRAGQFDPKALDAYFRQWKSRFELFDADRPFYQVHHDLVEPKAAIKLLPGMLSVPLYYHAVETSESRYTPAQAARILVTAHAFATPGICHPQKKLFFNGGPWLAGKVFFLEGDSLFQTLMLNLLQYAPDHPHPNLCRTEADAPAWEMDNPFLPERIFPLGYLDYLTWQNRRVYLIPVEEDGQIWVKEVVEAPGLKLEGEIRDPMKVYVADEKKGLKMLYLNGAKALWRESSTFLDTKSGRVHTPLALRWVADMAYDNDLPATLTLRLMTVGVVVESNSKIVLHRMEHMPLPLRFLNDPELFNSLRQEIELAEKAKDKVYFAISTLARLLLANQADLPGSHGASPDDTRNLITHWKWDNNYWPPLELPFFALVQGLADNRPMAVQAWHDTLRQTAWNALEGAIRQAGDSTDALKAAVQARGVLGGGLKKLELMPQPAQPAEAQSRNKEVL